MYLIEDKGEVALYHDEYWVYAEYQDSRIKLNLPWDFNSNGIDHGWRAVSADFLKFPYHSLDYPTEDILLLWENGRDSWQALTFSTTSGYLTGLVSVVGDYYTNQELTDLHNSSGEGWYSAVADQTYFSTIGFYSGNRQFSDESRVPFLLEKLFGDIYTGITREEVFTPVVSSNLTDLEAYKYIASNSDLIDTFGSDIGAAKSHYTSHGKSEGRSLDSFSATDYLAKYSDLSAAFGDDLTLALKHYIEHGYSEGRTDTSSSSGSGSSSVDSSNLTDFQALNYIASYGDLIKAFGTDPEAAKSHYANFGKSEGRTLDDFDEWGYLASNNDLISSIGSLAIEAVKHYISSGYSQGKSTNSFNAQSYLNNYADLRNAFGNDEELATKHYVEFGFNEGRVF